jgi:putative tryptophan/tyrosine transport system substrate-binding protein
MTTMGRLAGVLILALALGLAAGPAEGQQPGRPWRLAWLGNALPRSSPAYQTFERRMRELGYLEGQNLVVDFRTAEGRIERLPELAAELVGRRPDVLLAVSTQGGLAAKNATRTVPIVLAAVGDPVGTGLVASLARPGGNITGSSLLNVELSGKGLQLLKEAVPAASRVAVLWNPANPFHREVLAATQAAAATQKIGLQLLDVQAAEDLPKALDAIAHQRADSLLVLPDAVSLANRKRILEFAASRRLPAMYPFREMVDDGGLLCYGPNLADSFRIAAEYVDRILKGARPGDLPIAQPTRFDFVVNLKSAKALGLTIPQTILVRADDVVR